MFLTELCSQGSTNMVKALLSRFQMSFRPFHCFLSKGPIKLDFTDIYLITFFGDANYGKTSAVRVIFFFGNVQNLMGISEIQRKIEKKYFVFEVIVSELVALICLY